MGNCGTRGNDEKTIEEDPDTVVVREYLQSNKNAYKELMPLLLECAKIKSETPLRNFSNDDTLKDILLSRLTANDLTSYPNLQTECHSEHIKGDEVDLNSVSNAALSTSVTSPRRLSKIQIGPKLSITQLSYDSSEPTTTVSWCDDVKLQNNVMSIFPKTQCNRTWGRGSILESFSLDDFDSDFQSLKRFSIDSTNVSNGEATKRVAETNWRYFTGQAERYIFEKTKQITLQHARDSMMNLMNKEFLDCSHAHLNSYLPKTIRYLIKEDIVKAEDSLRYINHDFEYNPELTSFNAVIAFADASGFTRMTENLAKLPDGAERIGHALNTFFQPLINCVEMYGADITKFSGDAMMIVFPASDMIDDSDSTEEELELKMTQTLTNALECCAELHKKCYENTSAHNGASNHFDDPAQEDCHCVMPDMELHIGVGCGKVTLLAVGGELNRWEFLMTGKPLEQIAVAEALSKRGDTVISPECVQALHRDEDFWNRFLVTEIPEKCMKVERIPTAKSMYPTPQMSFDRRRSNVSALTTNNLQQEYRHQDLHVMRRFIPMTCWRAHYTFKPISEAERERNLVVKRRTTGLSLKSANSMYTDFRPSSLTAFGSLGNLKKKHSYRPRQGTSQTTDLNSLDFKTKHSVVSIAKNKSSLPETIDENFDARKLSRRSSGSGIHRNSTDSKDDFSQISNSSVTFDRRFSDDSRSFKMDIDKKVSIFSEKPTLSCLKKVDELSEHSSYETDDSEEEDDIEPLSSETKCCIAKSHLEEMRLASIVFLSVGGLDQTNSHIQRVAKIVQRIAYSQEGSLNKCLYDDKGFLILIIFGMPPMNHVKDDTLRAVLFSLRVTEALIEEKFIPKAGVATGMVWCGIVGTETRREYTVLGDVVNLSARLMSNADENGILVDDHTYNATRNILEYKKARVMKLKGKSQSLKVRVPTGGLYSGKQTNRRYLTAIPMEEWKFPKKIHAMLDKCMKDDGFLYITGEPGSGKGMVSDFVANWAVENDFCFLEGNNLAAGSTLTVPLQPWREVCTQIISKVKACPKWMKRNSTLGSSGRNTRKKSTDSQLIQTLIKSQSQFRSVDHLIPWLPLTSLLVKDLDFDLDIVEAMRDADGAQSRSGKSILADLTRTLIAAFASRPPGESKGTVIVVHYHVGTSIYESSPAGSAKKIVEAVCRLTETWDRTNLPPLFFVLTARSHDMFPAAAAIAKKKECTMHLDNMDPIESKYFVSHYLTVHQLKREKKKIDEGIKSINLSQIKGDKYPVANTKIDESIDSGSKSLTNSKTKISTNSMGINKNISRNTLESGTDLTSPVSDFWGETMTQEFRDHLSDIRSFLASHLSPALFEYVYYLTRGNLSGMELLCGFLIDKKYVVPGPDGNLQVCDQLQTFEDFLQLEAPNQVIGVLFYSYEKLDFQLQGLVKAATVFEDEFTTKELLIQFPYSNNEHIEELCDKLTVMNIFSKDILTLRYRMISPILKMVVKNLILRHSHTTRNDTLFLKQDVSATPSLNLPSRQTTKDDLSLLSSLRNRTQKEYSIEELNYKLHCQNSKLQEREVTMMEKKFVVNLKPERLQALPKVDSIESLPLFDLHQGKPPPQETITLKKNDPDHVEIEGGREITEGISDDSELSEPQKISDDGELSEPHPEIIKEKFQSKVIIRDPPIEREDLVIEQSENRKTDITDIVEESEEEFTMESSAHMEGVGPSEASECENCQDTDSAQETPLTRTTQVLSGKATAPRKLIPQNLFNSKGSTKWTTRKTQKTISTTDETPTSLDKALPVEQFSPKFTAGKVIKEAVEADTSGSRSELD